MYVCVCSYSCLALADLFDNLSRSWPLALCQRVIVFWVDEFEWSKEALVEGSVNDSFMINTICFFALERSVTCWDTLPESLIPVLLSPPALYHK